MATIDSKSAEERGNDGSDGFPTDDCYTDDSEADCIDLVDSKEEDEVDDPTFGVLEETRSRFSNISLKKSRPRSCKKKDVAGDNKIEAVRMEIPQLDDQDDEFFEKVEKMIKDGQVKKLKVDQCKAYLRKHGLRLTGNKDVLISRIEEYLEVTDGEGEKKYAASSFVINCQGDSCMGDVLMFEQNVYEMFSIASRSATGPSLGTRTVAGRVVKESYGSAKQQHTFTIEVLWSKGEKPLPPLHPLLIKGRNLYRLKTLRQKWPDEDERRKVLQEKHTRGSIARNSRDIRVYANKTRMMNIGGRRVNNNGMSKTSTIAQGAHVLSNPAQQAQSQPIMPIQHPQQQPNCMLHTAKKEFQWSTIFEKAIIGGEQATRKFQNVRNDHHNNISLGAQVLSNPAQQAQSQPIMPIQHPQQQPNRMLHTDNKNFQSSTISEKPIIGGEQATRKFQNVRNVHHNNISSPQDAYTPNIRSSQVIMSRDQQSSNGFGGRSPPFRNQQSSNGFGGRSPPFKIQQGSNDFVDRLPFRDLTHVQPSTDGFRVNSDRNNGYTDGISNRPPPQPPCPQRYKVQRVCSYYRQGRCKYNDNCKFFHV